MENLQLPDEEITSGLYATSGSGVCKAGKRERLLWKEADDDATEMLPHFLCVKCFMSGIFLDSSIGFYINKSIENNGAAKQFLIKTYWLILNG